jgi:hypothetical protein
LISARKGDFRNGIVVIQFSSIKDINHHNLKKKISIDKTTSLRKKCIKYQAKNIPFYHSSNKVYEKRTSP